MAFLKMSLCRGRFGLSLGFLFKRLQSGEQGMDTSKFQSSCSLPALPPRGRLFCKADGQFECGESLLPPSLFLCPPSMGPPRARVRLPSPHRQLPQLYNSSVTERAEGPQVLKGCPGQTFQASLLLTHLLAAPAFTSDVLLQPYLSSWDELVK